MWYRSNAVGPMRRVSVLFESGEEKWKYWLHVKDDTTETLADVANHFQKLLRIPGPRPQLWILDGQLLQTESVLVLREGDTLRIVPSVEDGITSGPDPGVERCNISPEDTEHSEIVVGVDEDEQPSNKRKRKKSKILSPEVLISIDDADVHQRKKKKPKHKIKEDEETCINDPVIDESFQMVTDDLPVKNKKKKSKHKLQPNSEEEKTVKSDVTEEIASLERLQPETLKNSKACGLSDKKDACKQVVKNGPEMSDEQNILADLLDELNTKKKQMMEGKKKVNSTHLQSDTEESEGFITQKLENGNKITDKNVLVDHKRRRRRHRHRKSKNKTESIAVTAPSPVKIWKPHCTDFKRSPACLVNKERKHIYFSVEDDDVDCAHNEQTHISEEKTKPLNESHSLNSRSFYKPEASKCDSIFDTLSLLRGSKTSDEIHDYKSDSNKPTDGVVGERFVDIAFQSDAFEQQKILLQSQQDNENNSAREYYNNLSVTPSETVKELPPKDVPSTSSNNVFGNLLALEVSSKPVVFYRNLSAASKASGNKTGTKKQMVNGERNNDRTIEESESIDQMDGAEYVSKIGTVPREEREALLRNFPICTELPKAGEIIAFKELELNEHYTPELSDFKLAKVIDNSGDKQELTLKIFADMPQKKRTGKFELDIDEAAETEDLRVVSFSMLIEPHKVRHKD